MRKPQFWAFIVLTLFLGACATPFRSSVTRFHTAIPSPGKTFIIVAKNPAKEKSLELKTYAKIVSGYLQKEGYVPAGSAKPDLIVGIDYGISTPVEQNTGYMPSGMSGSFFYYSGNYWYPHPWYSPLYGPYPYNPYYGWAYNGSLYAPYEHSYLVYERVFELTMKQNGGDVVFEGRSVSLGRSQDLPKVMPYLVQAFFEGFPGENAKTVRVKIKPADGGDY